MRTDPDDLLFKRILLKNRLLDEDRIEECIEEKRRSEAAGRRKSLYKIIEEKGYLDTGRLQKVIRAHAQTKRIQLDAAYGRVAVRQGAITRQQLEICEEAHRERRFQVPLGEIMLDLGLISPTTHDELLTLARTEVGEDLSGAPGAGGPDPLDLEHYVRDRLRKDLLAAGSVLVAALLLVAGVAAPLAIGWSNRARLDGVRALLDAGLLDQAEERIPRIGRVGVGREALEEIRTLIQARRTVQTMSNLADRGEVDVALQTGEGLLARLPQGPAAREVREALGRLLLTRGESEAEAGRWAAAVLALQNAARVGATAAPDRLDAIRYRLLNEGTRLEMERRTAQAVETYRLVARLFPYLAQDMEEAERRARFAALDTTARDAIEAKRYEEALALFRQAATDFPSSYAAERAARLERLVAFHQALTDGDRARDAGRDSEARVAFERAISLADGDPDRAALAHSRLVLLDAKGERQLLEKRIAGFLDEVVGRIRLNETERARDVLSTVLALDAQNPRALALQRLLRLVQGMAYVAAGTLEIGENRRGSAAAPRHAVTLGAYFIDRNEVSNRDYLQFVRATGRTEIPDHWTRTEPGGSRTVPPEESDHPVVHVRWEDARAYAAWRGARLPREAEWERAAAGLDGRSWPWGNTRDGSAANLDRASPTSDRRLTAPPDAYPRDLSPSGCRNMAGNVSEWTEDAFEPYPEAPPDTPRRRGDYRVLRGGSYRFGLDHARCANRNPAPVEDRYPDVGFRCVVDVPAAMPELR